MKPLLRRGAPTRLVSSFFVLAWAACFGGLAWAAEPKTELHVFQCGRHGLGMAPDVPGTSAWPKCCEEWLRNRGLLTPKP